MKRIFKSLGPGLLFAGTAIGVSHLVQSTRAGAQYGFAMLVVVVLANLFKYPFFEFGSRYTAYTHRHLLAGYHQFHKGFLILYLVLSVGTLFTVSAAVTLVTAGLISLVFPGVATIWIAGILYLLMWGLLVVGKYGWLNQGMKVMGVILLTSTLAAFVAAATYAPTISSPNLISVLNTDGGFFFAIALIGWMPTALDVSSWHSLWTVQRAREEKKKIQATATLRDFNIGYGFSALSALLFLALGAWLLFDQPADLPASAGGFARVIIGLFTDSLGAWAWPVVFTAALVTMISTSITVLDGYSRVMQEGLKTLSVRLAEEHKFYKAFAGVMAIGGMVIIQYFVGHLKSLIDLAMIISFLISPVVAVINFRLVTHSTFPKEGRPGMGLQVLGWLGLIFMVGFAFAFGLLYF